MNFNSFRGSEWRQWDLHIHSDASDGNMTCEQIIDKASEKKISVIALTDHHTASNIDKILEIGDSKGISVIPGIEFRTDKGKRSVHIIALFPREFEGIKITTEVINSYILNPLDLSRTKIIQKGKEKLKEDKKDVISDEQAFKVGIFECQVNFEKAANMIHQKLGGLVIVHAGSKSNSLEEEISHDGKTNTDKYNSLGPLKNELFLEGYIDICEINNEKDNREFYLKKFNKPSIIGSDAHNLNEIGIKSFWIKADPTFEGLKQIIYEPERVCLEEVPNKLELIKNYPDNFIDKIIIKIKNDDNEWFDKINEIQLNSDLVSIIGNKGMGKSALADIIGSSGNANVGLYSFLNKEKYLKHSSCIKYIGVLQFKDGSTCSKEFSNPTHDSKASSKVIYFSQSFVNTLCENDDVARLQDEIDRVIFSHIPNESKLGTSNLSELISKKTSSLDSRILEERNKLDEVNKKIIQTEEYLNNPETKIKWVNTLKEKEKLYKEIESKKPNKVDRPKADDNKPILDDVTKKKEEIKSINHTIFEINNKIKISNDDIFELEKIRNEILDFERKYQDLKKEIESNLVFNKYQLKLDDLLQLKFNANSINRKIDTEKESVKTLEINKSKSESKIIELNNSIKNLEKNLTEKQRAYKKYLEELESWNNRLNEIKGNDEIKDSIIYLGKWIKWYDNDLPSGRQGLLTKREIISNTILNLINEKKSVYPALYSFAKIVSDNRAHEFEIEFADFLQFNSKYSLSKRFKDDLFSFLDLRFAGTFHTSEKGSEQLELLLNKINFEKIDDIKTLPNTIINAFENDLSQISTLKSNYESQILPNKKNDLYNFLFGFNYLDPRFSITFGGKSINYLSPGEKGTLLLIFYLLIDKDKRPIIIDQPEENLDNQTVYQKLVKFIKKIKNTRQVIIVTHNPNLAIVCDSEQIIYAHIDKDSKNLVSYTCGSIENLGIREKAIDILEGTKPAFKNRKDKYEIK